MKYLIVTADDFGLTKSINEGIALAYTEGIVTCAGIIPAGEAFEDALERASKAGIKEITAHLALTEISPTLKTGKFYKGRKSFLADLFLGRIKKDAIYSELKNQMEILKKARIRIAAMSSHEHLHMVPPVLEIFICLAKEYAIPSIRYPRRERSASFGFGKLYRTAVVSYLEKGMARLLDKADIKYTDHFLGFLDSGNLTEELLVKMLGSVEEGTTELVAHPGFLGPQILDRYRFHINCERELAALTSRRVMKAVEDNRINLKGR